LRDDVVATYGAALPSAVTCLQDDFEACIAHLRFPLAHRRAIRTTKEHIRAVALLSSRETEHVQVFIRGH